MLPSFKGNMPLWVRIPLRWRSRSRSRLHHNTAPSLAWGTHAWFWHMTPGFHEKLSEYLGSSVSHVSYLALQCTIQWMFDHSQSSDGKRWTLILYFSRIKKNVFASFCAIFLLLFFRMILIILCTYFLYNFCCLKFCQVYLVSFFHLWANQSFVKASNVR